MFFYDRIPITFNFLSSKIRNCEVFTDSEFKMVLSFLITVVLQPSYLNLELMSELKKAGILSLMGKY